MSTLFDFAFSRAVPDEITTLARTILMMTDYEKYQNNMFYDGRMRIPICWDLLVSDVLIFLMKFESERSSLENRTPTISNVLTLVKQGHIGLESTLAKLPIWNDAGDLKQGAVEELDERLSDICAMPDLERRNEFRDHNWNGGGGFPATRL